MTTDITELWQRMKAAAKKASNGDWVKESGDGWEAVCSANDQANVGFIIAHFVGPDAAENREFVQAANPANVLALVEALEYYKSREERVTSLVRDNSKSWDELYRQVEAKGKRNVELVEALEKAQQVDEELCKLLPLGAEYMDPPDGGDVTPLEGVRRMVADYRQRIAELESRTVTVKLTDINDYLAEVHDKTLNRAFRILAEGVRAGDVAAMRAAGIKVEAE